MSFETKLPQSSLYIRNRVALPPTSLKLNILDFSLHYLKEHPGAKEKLAILSFFHSFY